MPKGIPDNIMSLLKGADAKHGFPAGTMASVLQQEVGGNLDKFLSNPGEYHYAAGKDGRRVAPHTGKESTAFGPFGILESTGADPGYGVKPLQSKDLAEQVRFAGEYLAARTKQAGSLVGGLAGYGEGTKYANQVLARTEVPVAGRSGGPIPNAAPAAVPGDAAPAGNFPYALPKEVVEAFAVKPVQVGPAQADPWTTFLSAMPQAKAPVRVADLNYQGMRMPTMPAFQPRVTEQRPNFAAFSTFGRFGKAA